MSANPPDRPIIFFDGVCGLCNAFVDILLRLDHRQLFLFAPLQGETARALLPPLTGKPELWSMLYLDETGPREHSDGVLAICQRLGGLWAVLGWLRFVPRILRDPIYRLVARYRYRLVRKRETCRLPSAAERARFLP